MNNPSPPQHADLHREIRTTLARLELCSSAKTQTFNPGGGRSTDEHPGGKRPPGGYGEDGWYRDRLHDLDHGRPRRVPKKPGDNVKVRDSYALLLGHASAALEALTGRDDKAPERKAAKMDDARGLENAVREDAPGKPADDVAAKLGATKFMVRRIYVDMQLDPLTGEALSTTKASRASEVARLAAQGMGERSIALALGVARGTVRKALGKAA